MQKVLAAHRVQLIKSHFLCLSGLLQQKLKFTRFAVFLLFGLSNEFVVSR